MTAKTVWLSEQLWRQLPLELRRQVRDATQLSLPEYAANIESALRARGEHQLADELVLAVDDVLHSEDAPARAAWVSWEHLGSWDRPQLAQALAEGATPEGLVAELIATRTIGEEDREPVLRFLRDEAAATIQRREE